MGYAQLDQAYWQGRLCKADVSIGQLKWPNVFRVVVMSLSKAAWKRIKVSRRSFQLVILLCTMQDWNRCECHKKQNVCRVVSSGQNLLSVLIFEENSLMRIKLMALGRNGARSGLKSTLSANENNILMTISSPAEVQHFCPAQNCSS